MSARPPFPPFTKETAQAKVKAAQALWNTRDPAKVALAYTENTLWRNRDVFLKGREAVEAFLQKKWDRETHYRLRKELFAWEGNKIAVQFWYEYFDTDAGGWFRCYGLEDWTFEDNGLMRKRQMSGNDVAISEDGRWFKDDVENVDEVKISEIDW